MKIQTENSLSIYQASLLPKPLLMEYCGELRVAKVLASPRESWLSELVSSPPESLTTTGSVALPKEMTGVNLRELSQKLTTIFLRLEAKEECNKQA